MSATSYDSIRDYHRPRRRPRQTDVTVDTVKVKARRRSGISTAQFVGWQMLLMGFVIAITFGFSVLMGSSLMENARRDKVKAITRMSIARDDMARLRNRMDRLTTMAAVDTWARSRSFVPPHGLPLDSEGSSVVAQLD